MSLLRGFGFIVLVLLAVACADDAENPAQETCELTADTTLEFTAVALDTDLSDEGCPAVTAEQLNAADQSECTRRVEDCTLVLGCDFDVSGLRVLVTSRLKSTEDGKELTGSASVDSVVSCRYGLRARVKVTHFDGDAGAFGAVAVPTAGF